MPLALIVHGGAGMIALDLQDTARAGCAAAASRGWATLLAGGSALDAVTVAVMALEDNPAFNAGTGAVLTRDGTAELDAGIMEGATLEVGAVAGVRRIKNPILLARAVLASPQVLLSGAGAEEFAESQGIAFCDPAVLVTTQQRARWQTALREGDRGDARAHLTDPNAKHGTVGAVALDAAGHIVAASSTGGVMLKPTGRVGDTPVPGAGFYAEDGIGGVACTGHGEDFLRLVIARRAIEILANGKPAQIAADETIALLGSRIAGAGGMIMIDALGRVGFACNTTNMAYAYLRDGQDTPIAGV